MFLVRNIVFRRDQGRGDIAARLIEAVRNFVEAKAIFDDWRLDANPRAMEQAVDAMVARLRKEGETPDTNVFLESAFKPVTDNVPQYLPPDPHGVNDPHRYEWAIMIFEGMWKKPNLFPKKTHGE